MRIRSLKPEILTDEKSAGLSDTEWRLFVSCIVMSDDYGNLRASQSFLYSQCFWATQTSREDVARARETLARLSLLVLYEVGGQQYAHVAGWYKHQKVDHPGKPLCPRENSEGVQVYTPERIISRDSRETLASPRETLAPDQDGTIDGNKDMDKELYPACGPAGSVCVGSPASALPRSETPEAPSEPVEARSHNPGTDAPPRAFARHSATLALPGVDAESAPSEKPVRSTTYSTAFDAAWKLYGRKIEKVSAWKQWRIESKLAGGEERLRELVVAALAWQAPDLAKEGWRYAPYFERYLKAHRWEDEKTPTAGAGSRATQAPLHDVRFGHVRAEDMDHSGPIGEVVDF